MCGKLADAKVAEDELQLGGRGQAGSPDVLCRATPQLHRAARPAVLLLPVCEETGRQLHGNIAHSCMQDHLPAQSINGSASVLRLYLCSARNCAITGAGSACYSTMVAWRGFIAQFMLIT